MGLKDVTITYNIFYHLARWLAQLFFGYRVVHPERIPPTGGMILAVNHTSYFDPPLAGVACKRGVYYLARKSLLEWPFFGPMFPDMNVIPVERDGNDRSALKAVIRKIQDGNGVVLFPEGTRSKTGDLQPAQPGIGLIVAKTLAPVVPMRIFGAFEAFPRGAKGIKFRRISVVVGEPIYFTPDDVGEGKREDYLRLSQRIMEAIGQLKLP